MTLMSEKKSPITMPSKKCKLSVNLNKIATLRNSRGGSVPSVTEAAQHMIQHGAHGITVHPRPDERHIKKQDVFELSGLIKEINKQKSNEQKIEFNIEGYPSNEFLSLIEEVRPDQATLVPDPPEVLTSNAGWKIKENLPLLKKVQSHLKSFNVRSSFFIDVFTWNESEEEALLELKPDRVELYTEKYATDFGTSQQNQTLQRYKEVAQALYDQKIGLNAGHDLNLNNIHNLVNEIPQIEEVSIGHALIAEALYLGLETTIKKYLKEMGYENSFS